MQAWGATLPGELRPSDDHPTKSGVLGMLGACLGLRDHQEEEMQSLQNNLLFACREDLPGSIMEDYHTVQLPIKRFQAFDAKTKIRKGEDTTLISTRQYLCDAMFTVSLSGALESLEALKAAIEKPEFTPYLGRKCCLPALSMRPQIVEATTIQEAFSKYVADPDKQLSRERPPKQRVFWEGTDTSIPVQKSYPRQDLLNSRRTRTFRRRTEHQGWIERNT
jgi:CRISPR system Cascade subunit CasD